MAEKVSLNQAVKDNISAQTCHCGNLVVHGEKLTNYSSLLPSQCINRIETNGGPLYKISNFNLNVKYPHDVHVSCPEVYTYRLWCMKCGTVLELFTSDEYGYVNFPGITDDLKNHKKKPWGMEGFLPFQIRRFINFVSPYQQTDKFHPKKSKSSFESYDSIDDQMFDGSGDVFVGAPDGNSGIMRIDYENLLILSHSSSGDNAQSNLEKLQSELK